MTDPSIDDQLAIPASVVGAGADRRHYRRRTVLWPAIFSINGYDFKCQVWNMSLLGARIHLNLPIAVSAEGQLAILGRTPIDVRVCWREGDVLGLEFLVDAAVVRSIFADRMAALDLDQMI